MDNESKKFISDQLQKEFYAFMEAMMRIPGLAGQKQLAFIRFEEGHMWMQCALAAHEPVPVAPQPAQEPVQDITEMPVDSGLCEPSVE